MAARPTPVKVWLPTVQRSSPLSYGHARSLQPTILLARTGRNEEKQKRARPTLARGAMAVASRMEVKVKIKIKTDGAYKVHIKQPGISLLRAFLDFSTDVGGAVYSAVHELSTMQWKKAAEWLRGVVLVSWQWRAHDVQVSALHYLVRAVGGSAAFSIVFVLLIHRLVICLNEPIQISFLFLQPWRTTGFKPRPLGIILLSAQENKMVVFSVQPLAMQGPFSVTSESSETAITWTSVALR